MPDGGAAPLPRLQGVGVGIGDGGPEQQLGRSAKAEHGAGVHLSHERNNQNLSFSHDFTEV